MTPPGTRGPSCATGEAETRAAKTAVAARKTVVREGMVDLVVVTVVIAAAFGRRW